jgi:hypothetical protein
MVGRIVGERAVTKRRQSGVHTHRSDAPNPRKPEQAIPNNLELSTGSPGVRNASNVAHLQKAACFRGFLENEKRSR